MQQYERVCTKCSLVDIGLGVLRNVLNIGLDIESGGDAELQRLWRLGKAYGGPVATERPSPVGFLATLHPRPLFIVVSSSPPRCTQH